MLAECLQNPTFRRLRRQVLAVFLVASWGHSFGWSEARAEAEALESGIHYPIDASWNSEYSRVEELLRQTEWNEAIERLLQRAQRLDELASGDLPGDARTFAVPTGGGFALGARAALQRLLGLLPEDRRDRLQAILDAELVEIWRKSMESATREERAALRHYLLRTQPTSATALDAAREEIDVGLHREQG